MHHRQNQPTCRLVDDLFRCNELLLYLHVLLSHLAFPSVHVEVLLLLYLPFKSNYSKLEIHLHSMKTNSTHLLEVTHCLAVLPQMKEVYLVIHLYQVHLRVNSIDN